MAEYQDREHYIPLRRSDLVELLATDKDLAEEQREPFRQFCRLVTAVLHYQYHDKLEELKNEYAPFDPDQVTKTVKELSSEEKETQQQRVFDKFTWVMERANYKRLSRDEMMKATEAASAWGINLDIDFSLFKNLEIYIRGDTMGTRVKRHWLQFWKMEEVRVPVYKRVVVILKLQPHPRLDSTANTDSVYLKMFKEIPKEDIEMLLPGGRLKMPKLAVGKLGASLVGAVGFVGYKLFTEFGILLSQIGRLNPLAFWTPVSLIAGYGYKQYAGYQTARQAFNLQLTRSLYYLNLDNNAGVLYHILDEAEEQECREIILAYYYLWRYAPEKGWTAADLDEYVEMDLERLVDLKVDFEIEDALDKLETFGLIEKNEDRYRTISIEKALELLDYKWDNYFTYNVVKTES